MDRERLIHRIWQVIASDDYSAQDFSRILFGPGGLFSQLAPTDEERPQLVRTPPFKEANARQTEWERLDWEQQLKARRQFRAARKKNAAAPANGPAHAPADTPKTDPV